jgi:predicted Fe-S protein YdhL (DUF1289 family)
MEAIDLLAERARLVGAGLTGDVPSPCSSVCKMDSATEFCEGCFRTLDEIAGWSRLDDESRRAVWQLIAQRLDQKRAA